MRRGWPRIRGHREGAKAARAITRTCANLGVKYLTLYSFSVENWARPVEEVQALMELCVETLREEREALQENNVRLVHIGRREGLPDAVLQALDETVRQTSRNTGLTLALALNYGGRAELLDAVRAIARQVQAGAISPEQIDDSMISAALYTAGMPDPDLLIRTAGQMRISNFLLWQISYAELYVTQTLWPDFDRDELFRAIRDYARRERRFGGLEART